MNDTVIAVCGTDPGMTPMMPYIGEKNDGKVFTERAKYLTEAALCRCGFDTVSVTSPITDTGDAAMAANHIGADCIVIISYASFGSGRNFNDANGCTVEHAQGRAAKSSRILAEDICSYISAVKPCVVSPSYPMFSGALRPTVTVNAGYLTGFDDAKLIYDPDHAARIAERITMGICENFSMPYILPSEATIDPVSLSIGKRGKKIKLLQAMLSAHGYRLAVDGVFGRNTDLALKKFCGNNDTPLGTVADALLMRNQTDIKIGSEKAAVRYLQNKLRAKLYRAPLDGVLGKDTVDAVNAYLADIGHPDAKNDDTVSETAIELLSPVGGGKPRLF